MKLTPIDPYAPHVHLVQPKPALIVPCEPSIEEVQPKSTLMGPCAPRLQEVQSNPTPIVPSELHVVDPKTSIWDAKFNLNKLSKFKKLMQRL